MRRYRAQLIVGALGIVWLVVATLVVPALIRSAYNGDSIEALNGIISGQAEIPVEAYLGRWQQFAWLTLALFVVVIVPLSLTTPKRILKMWKRYWFAPTALGYLAACRIICVLTELLHVLIGQIDRRAMFEAAAMPAWLYGPLPILRLFLWPWGAEVRPTLDVVAAVHWLTAVAGVTALVGFRSNISLLIFAAGCTFLQSYLYSFGEIHHPEAVLVIVLWALALSPAGRALSIDDVLARGASVSRIIAQARRNSRFAGWPLLLGQCLLAIVYLDAALRKLWMGGLNWMNGYTLQFYLLNDGLSRGNEVGVWLASQHLPAMILSWLSIAFEATFFVVLFLPALCWIYIPVGVAFHVGTAVVAMAWFYQFIALYVTFLPKLVRTFLRFRSNPSKSVVEQEVLELDAPGDRPLVMFDGACNLCNGWVRFVTKRDKRGIIAFAPFESAIGRAVLEKHGIQHVARDSVVFVARNHAHVKSDAVLEVATHLDGAWATMRVLRVVPKSWRNWCYDIVARNRYRWFGVREHESCALPTKEVLSRFVDK